MSFSTWLQHLSLYVALQSDCSISIWLQHLNLYVASLIAASKSLCSISSLLQHLSLYVASLIEAYLSLCSIFTLLQLLSLYVASLIAVYLSLCSIFTLLQLLWLQLFCLNLSAASLSLSSKNKGKIYSVDNMSNLTSDIRKVASDLVSWWHVGGVPMALDSLCRGERFSETLRVCMQHLQTCCRSGFHLFNLSYFLLTILIDFSFQLVFFTLWKTSNFLHIAWVPKLDYNMLLEEMKLSVLPWVTSFWWYLVFHFSVCSQLAWGSRFYGVFLSNTKGLLGVAWSFIPTPRFSP